MFLMTCRFTEKSQVNIRLYLKIACLLAMFTECMFHTKSVKQDRSNYCDISKGFPDIQIIWH